jgi:hypothetical protein
VQNLPRNTSDVGRSIGSVSADWDPARWLKVSYTLGADFFNERRLEGLPPYSSGEAFTGQLWQGSYTNRQVDHNLLATLSRQLSPKVASSLTLGQNLNWRSVRQQQVKGDGFIDPGLFTLNNMVPTNLTPQNFASNTNIAGYFGEAEARLRRLRLPGRAPPRRPVVGAVEGEPHRLLPGVSLALNVTNMLGRREQSGALSYLKARGAYGVAGPRARRVRHPHQLQLGAGRVRVRHRGATAPDSPGNPGPRRRHHARAQKPALRAHAEAEAGSTSGCSTSASTGR